MSVVRTDRRLTYLLLGLVLALLAAGTVSGKTIDVTLGGATEKISAYENKDVVYFSFSELVDVLGGTLDWKIIGHRVTYTDGLNRFEFLIGSPYFTLNDSVYNLTYPVDLSEGRLYLPVTTFIPRLDQVAQQKVTWDGRAEILRIDSDIYNVTDLSIEAKANGVLIEIFLSKSMPYEIFITEGDWINVSIRDGILNRSRILSRLDRRYVYKLKAHQVAGAGQVSIRLRRPVQTWHHRLLSDPPRIQISVVDEGFQIDSADTGPQIGPDEKIDVIVIDAGHGGRQYGAVGPGGTREKDIALDIAHKLAKLIRKDKQFQVIMTRDRDKTVSLEERADIANKAGCDLFISIHANSSTKRHVRGWNVFFLAPARNDSARAVAQFENSAFLRDQSEVNKFRENDEETLFEDPVLSILNEMIMTEFQTESHDFAMMCDREFRRKVKTTARGVDQAGFFVLNRVYAPSVLVESGFISNRTEERALRTDDYQENVAEALYDAIKRFKAKYEKYADKSE